MGCIITGSDATAVRFKSRNFHTMHTIMSLILINSKLMSPYNNLVASKFLAQSTCIRTFCSPCKMERVMQKQKIRERNREGRGGRGVVGYCSYYCSAGTVG